MRLISRMLRPACDELGAVECPEWADSEHGDSCEERTRLPHLLELSQGCEVHVSPDESIIATTSGSSQKKCVLDCTHASREAENLVAVTENCHPNVIKLMQAHAEVDGC